VSNMDWEGSSTMPYTGEGIYSCGCGCNSFSRHRVASLYKCRGCGVTHFSRSVSGARRISPVGAASKGGQA
jgi:hypothetical protein